MSTVGNALTPRVIFLLDTQFETSNQFDKGKLFFHPDGVVFVIDVPSKEYAK